MSNIEETVIIVGAGLAGIGVSHYLSKHGIPYLILEKADACGGVWRALDWPGIRCDTEILNYSYSFNPLLSQRKMVSGDEIRDYLESTAHTFGIVEHINFDTRVTSASYSTADHRWYVQTTRGVFSARFLINTNGYFDDRPHMPQIAESEHFSGEIHHLFEIDRHTNLDGKNIVLVGSGASAISAAPALARRSRHLTLLQRSPSYIYEDNNRVGWFSDKAQQLYRAGFRFPVTLINWLQQCKSDLVFVSFRKLPRLGRWFFRRHWKDSVDRDSYTRHFEPDYQPWEQRIPVALGFKPLLGKAEFKLVTGQIACFEADGVLLVDGRRVHADTFVFATGFNLNFFRFAIAVDGEAVETRGINFYKSMMMGGLPNYFQPFGPPHTSFTRRVETISRLIVKIIRYMEKEQLDSVSIERKTVALRPPITPGYVTRKLDVLPAFYGSLELPSIDNLLFYRFRPADYRFDAESRPARPAYCGGARVDEIA